jgi:hypothetical protein
MSKNALIVDAEQSRIAALASSVNTEERWVSFMVQQGYPADSPKMRDGHTRLTERVAILDNALVKQSQS